MIVSIGLILINYFIKSIDRLNSANNFKLKMNIVDILSVYPGIYKLMKIWQFKFGETMYFGSGNASGTLRFTNNYSSNVSLTKLIILFIMILSSYFQKCYL